MGEVLSFPARDGGMARIERRQHLLFQQEPVDDLVMMRPDCAYRLDGGQLVDTSPCEYVAPAHDLA